MENELTNERTLTEITELEEEGRQRSEQEAQYEAAIEAQNKAELQKQEDEKPLTVGD